jgi:MoxR-like ATPase
MRRTTSATPTDTTAEEVDPGVADGAGAFAVLEANLSRVLRGKERAIRLAVACLLAEGHLLIEDRPGTGKTSLAKAIAISIGGSVRRVQFTPDLLPSDVIGVSVFDPRSGSFRYREGPVFTNVLVADEINRASPKTQAALLEVMDERQVTADGSTRPVPRPFLVIATQNPLDFQGTYPLPEVQLDRFAMKLTLGYADRRSELEIMASHGSLDVLAALEPVLDVDRVQAVARALRAVEVSRAVREYVADLVEASRTSRDLRLGISTRGTLTLLAVARAYAVGSGRDYVTPDDIKTLAAPVLVHRMAVTTEADLDGLTEADVLDALLDEVPVPRTRR